MRARLAVLASGGGTNLQALLDYFETLGDQRSGDVVLVASDRPGAGAVDRATRRGIATALVGPTTAAGGAMPLEAILEEHRAEIVVLAGYLRLVPAHVVERYRGRIVNVHPALLPAFGGSGMYGARVHQAVLDAGVAVSGATVHFVDDAYDRGAIIAQWPVPVLRGDSASTLAARVLRVEHALYPPAVDAVAGGRIIVGPDGTVQRRTSASSAEAVRGGADLAFCLSTAPGPRLATDVARLIDA